jgi:hypothetical protein
VGIAIDCNPGETEWQEVQFGDWLGPKDEVRVNLANWSASRLLNRFDLRLRLRAGQAKLYGYFPFAFKFSADAPQAEIGEIERPDQVIELLLEQVAPDWRGRLTLSFISEQSGVPHSLGLGLDRRDLALCLEAVMIRQCGSTALSPAVEHGCADLDLEGDERATSPVFVVGSGRCGSSVLTWALGQHPNIVPLEETGWLPMTLYGAIAGFRMASSAKQNFPSEYHVDLDRFLRHIGGSIDSLHHAAARLHARADFLKRLSGRADQFDPSFQRIRTNWSPKQRWVDGTPLNTSVMPILARTFPKSQFVGIIRDPVDVIASYKAFHTIAGPSYSTEEAATFWLQAAYKELWMRESLGAHRIMIVDYREFAQPADLIRRVMRFLGEPNYTSSVKPMEKRINSSNVTEEQRKAVSGPLVDKCAAVYAKIRAGASWSLIDWDDDINPNYEAWLQDLVGRLIKAIS